MATEVDLYLPYHFIVAYIIVNILYILNVFGKDYIICAFHSLPSGSKLHHSLKWPPCKCILDASFSLGKIIRKINDILPKLFIHKLLFKKYSLTLHNCNI